MTIFFSSHYVKIQRKNINQYRYLREVKIGVQNIKIYVQITNRVPWVWYLKNIQLINKGDNHNDKPEINNQAYQKSK